MSNYNTFPFADMGFLQTDENLWVKFTEGLVSSPHIAITTTVNPISMTFLVKDIINNETISTNSIEKVRELVLSSVREDKLKKLLEK